MTSIPDDPEWRNFPIPDDRTWPLPPWHCVRCGKPLRYPEVHASVLILGRPYDINCACTAIVRGELA